MRFSLATVLAVGCARGFECSGCDTTLATALGRPNAPCSEPCRSIQRRQSALTHLSSWLTNAINPQQVLDKQVFFRKEERLLAHPSLGSGQTHRIGPGNHEWRFSINMKGDLPESIEGLPSSYIVYELTAVLQKGYITGNMIVKKHIRVIRAMGRDALESIIFEQVRARLP